MTKSVTINFQLVKTDTQNFVANKTPLIANVSGIDWMSFLDALGWVENNGQYGGLGGFNNAYAGMYQAGDLLLKYIKFDKGVGQQLLGITRKEELAKNPIAEDIAAIMEFSGTPKETLNKHQFSAPRFSKSGFETDFHRNPV